MDWMLFFTLTMLFLLVPEITTGQEKITIGALEEVILLPWGVKLPTRIDTGATKSSLDAQEMTVRDDMVEFRLPQQYGGLPLRLPIVEWRHVRSPGNRERRPVVELEICLGSNRIRTKVNLTDRSSVKYPLILGRNFLRKTFVVDVRRRMTTPPVCGEIPRSRSF